MISSPIITKTLTPSRPADLVRRERLLDFLHEHIDRKLIFIAAPAGYGKTTLLVDFAHETDLTVCWYSLDATDRDLRTFIEGLLASLRRRYPGFGKETQSVLEASVSLGEDVLSIAGTLINEMVAAIPEWFVLILDDFHHVEDAFEVTRFLSTLLTYQPEHCHLIIASRTVPGTLPFISLAARGEVEGLGPADLRFTPEEIRRLFDQDPSLRLSPEEVERLTIESEGWIAGILLARHALNRRGDLWARARASGCPLYEYLASEVLEGQEPPIQAFLLASSTLEEMNSHPLRTGSGTGGGRGAAAATGTPQPVRGQSEGKGRSFPLPRPLSRVPPGATEAGGSPDLPRPPPSGGGLVRAGGGARPRGPALHDHRRTDGGGPHAERSG